MNKTNKRIDPKILAVIQKLRLFDDPFMTCVFEDNIEGVTLMLHILLERDDLIVRQVTTQRKYTNLLGHSVWLDIVAEDKDGKLYDIEVQRGSEGANPRRARYHSSMLDSRLLAKGEDYAALKDSYVIFITESDVFRKGLPLYHFERTMQEGGEPFGDGSRIIYVNGAYENNDDPVGKLMHDFRCRDAAEMLHPILAERVRYLKEDEGGKNSMGDSVQDLLKELAQEWAKDLAKELAEEKAKELAEERAEETALTLLGFGLLSYEKIAEASRLTVEKVKALDAQRTA